MVVTINTVSEFDRQIKQLAKKYRSIPSDFQTFVDDLKKNPLQGVDLGGGVRKIRMTIASKGKGKSGGARVITYNVVQCEDHIHVQLLSIYDKSEMENVSDKYIESLIKNL